MRTAFFECSTGAVRSGDFAVFAKTPERYSRVRLWVPAGFTVAVAGFGWLFDRVSIAYFPAFVALTLLAIFARAAAWCEILL
ncbi:MAG: MFS transporter [Pseudomonadales bacterium]